MRCFILPVLTLWSAVSVAQFQKKKIEIPDWNNAVRFELVTSQSPVRPGDSFELALLADIQEGYHLYGPEEPEPTRTAVSVKSVALKAGKASYPPPARRELEGLGAYNLYEGSVAIRVPVTLSREFKGKTLEAPVEVAYQLCTDFACSAPTTKVVSASLPTAALGSDVKKLHPAVFQKK
jgi:DsbC/DsbD-like thiol-disulfide interchange protein